MSAALALAAAAFWLALALVSEVFAALALAAAAVWLAAAALSCESESGDIPCGNCPNCRKILSGKSPDVIFVKKEDGKAQIGVDVIRELRNDVVVYPNDLEKKVYIIDLKNILCENTILTTRDGCFIKAHRVRKITCYSSGPYKMNEDDSTLFVDEVKKFFDVSGE